VKFIILFYFWLEDYGCEMKESNTKIYKNLVCDLLIKFMSFCNVTEPAVVTNELT
jgi:hypothetical protein